ncbi:recombination mediator RecR [Desulfuribacillus alkaliarsenatis]|uniref:Recombination protein RecR n=1 Tax=Desulfuribacillus alkaliarsenatis TaxID=766136 RepID=A0A1E5FZ07_9FIRM|nr:recombination protein RecR [Desulfuribacillus alkaliarsenatis]
MHLPEPMLKLVESFMRLPGIGPKTAQRLAFFVLKMPDKEVLSFAEALHSVKTDIMFCQECQNISDSPVCQLCQDGSRDHSIICVVEQPKDVIAIERMQEFRGKYHVLQGAISPMDDIGPEDIKIKELIHRLSDERIEEVILAMDPNIEGEATAMYLSRLIKPTGIKVTRLAHGLPVGGDLEYADEITLAKAIEGRKPL